MKGLSGGKLPKRPASDFGCKEREIDGKLFDVTGRPDVVSCVDAFISFVQVFSLQYTNALFSKFERKNDQKTPLLNSGCPKYLPARNSAQNTRPICM